jgi:hypothetical protein
MVFGTSLRVAADRTQPLNRRVTNLSNAVEKFGPMGFHRTFAHLSRATGASHGLWTDDQVDIAVDLLRHAHDSWQAYAQAARDEAHFRKSAPGYRPLRIDDVFEAWWVSYFVGERRLAWHLDAADHQVASRSTCPSCT